MNSRRALWLLALWLIVLAAAAPPWGDFPLSDDWAFADSVRWLLQDHRLRMPDFSVPNAVLNILWGALFCLPAGFSHVALRLSMLAASALALVGWHLLLEELGFGAEDRLLGCAILAWNPLFLLSGYLFYTEAVFLAVFFPACWATLRGVRRGDRRWLWAGSALAALAYLDRQLALALPLAAAWTLRQKDRKARPRDYIAAVGLPILTAGVHAGWFYGIHGVTQGVAAEAAASAARFSRPARLAFESLQRAGAAVQYLGLFVSPLALAALGRPRSLPRDRRRVAWLAGIGALLAVAWLSLGPLPDVADQISRRGLGYVSVPSAADKAAGWFGSGLLWGALNLLSVLGAFHLASRASEARGPGPRFLGAATLAMGAACLASATFFDRYFLVLLPWAAAVSLSGRGRRAIAWACAGALGLVWVCGLRDYLAWNAALWQAGARAESAGVPPESLFGGLSWNGALSGHKNMALLKARLPVRSIQPFQWLDPERFVAFATFSPRAQPPLAPLLSAGYRTPFDPAGGEVYVYRLPLGMPGIPGAAFRTPLAPPAKSP